MEKQNKTPSTLSEEQLRVYQVIANIPLGRVMSYGAVADAAGLPGRARWVGKVMSQLPKGSKLPWHRVVSASGKLIAPVAEIQQQKLRDEGLEVRSRVPRSAFL